MKEFIMSLPLWFCMLFITAITGTGIYILAKADRIKAGPLEIEDKPETSTDNKE